jgi:hypothetical protein
MRYHKALPQQLLLVQMQCSKTSQLSQKTLASINQSIQRFLYVKTSEKEGTTTNYQSDYKNKKVRNLSFM